jgi:hypothetical protein
MDDLDWRLREKRSRVANRHHAENRGQDVTSSPPARMSAPAHQTSSGDVAETARALKAAKRKAQREQRRAIRQGAGTTSTSSAARKRKAGSNKKASPLADRAASTY